MNLKINRSEIIQILKGLIIGLFVVIVTFPENNWSFTTGIDSPLSWVFNCFFEHGLNIGKHIIFPHGPLAFFMYPLQPNILIATFITSLLKLLLTLNLLKLVDERGRIKWILAFVIAYLFSIIADFNSLILINIILLYLIFFLTENRFPKLLAFLLTAFAFYVKSDVAIMSGIIGFSFLAYYFYIERSFKKLGLDVVTVSGLFLVLWFLIYGTLSGFITYVAGMIHLAQDSSSSVSYYPYNNWWILSLFLIIVFSIPFVNRTKKSVFYGVLITLGLFAAWKHGMAREDVYHVKGLLIFVIMSLSVFILFNKQKPFRNIILCIFAVFLLNNNMKHSENYFPTKYEFFRINNFFEFVTELQELKAKSQKETDNNIKVNKLPQNLINTIKSGSVDIYPWDYSFIAANNLNWQPRVVIQSYASYNSWLDHKNAEHFSSKNAPAFFIWDINKNMAGELNGGTLESIDNRYLLNDEPQTILQILKNYKPFYNDKKVIVFKKRERPLITKNTIIAKDNSQWGKWISVPFSKGGLIRAKLEFNKSVLQRIKTFLYKDEQFWIYLKLTNGLIHKYRIVPGNAVDGIWIKPYILNPGNKFIDPQVKEIMFTCSNSGIISDNVSIQWEQIDFENKDYVLQFFSKSEKQEYRCYLITNNGFEVSGTEYWSKLSDNQIINNDFYSGSKSHILGPNSFSATFTFALDSITFGNMQITSDCWVKSKKYHYSNNISLVLSIDDSTGNIIWKSIPIDGQLTDRKQWNNIYNFLEYSHQKAGRILKAFIWNTSDVDILIDDFRVRISDCNHP
jgi:hypothetical protein